MGQTYRFCFQKRGSLFAFCFIFLIIIHVQVDLGSLHKRVSERGLTCIDESSCRYAMLFYRYSSAHENNQTVCVFFVSDAVQAIFVYQSSYVLLQKLVRSGS